MTPEDHGSRGINQYYNIDVLITVKSCGPYLPTRPEIAREAGTCLFALTARGPSLGPLAHTRYSQP